MVAPSTAKILAAISEVQNTAFLAQMDILTTRKEAKSLQPDTFDWALKLSKLLLLLELCPGPTGGAYSTPSDHLGWTG